MDGSRWWSMNDCQHCERRLSSRENSYDEWGAELSRACKQVKCTVRDDSTSATRCLYCDDAPEKARACLKCEGIPSASECVSCQWSDNAAVCRRCADAAGTLDYAGCDALRSDLGQR